MSLLSGSIKIEKQKSKYPSCNCCRSEGQSEDMWNIYFSSGAGTYASSTVIRLCDRHLKEMGSGIDKACR